jgi:hypothetical protein
MFPAVESTDPAVRPLVDDQSEGIPFAPHGSLNERWLELPVAAEDCSLALNEEERQ